MAVNGDTTYSDSASGFIDVFKYFSGSTETSESYRCIMDNLLRYERENPRIPMKVLRDVKSKVKSFGLKPSRNVRNIKQFIGHKFRVGSSKK